MKAHKFIPDYRAWWSKKDLSEDDLAWLVLGVKPEDAAKALKLQNEQIEGINNDGFLTEFGRYADTLPHGLFLGDMRNRILKEKMWGNGKEDFICNLYERVPSLTFPPDFELLLKSEEVIPKHLDHYKRFEIYTADLKQQKLASIESEDTALALLLGLNPGFFIRFRAYYKDKETKEDIPSEDRFFAHQYYQFLKREYAHLDLAPHIALFIFYDAVKELSLWTGEFKSYVQSLHDEGFIFRKQTYDALKAHKITLAYSRDCWAEQFYKRWLKEGAWTLKEALHLFRGLDPRPRGRSYRDISQNVSLYSLGDHFLTWDAFDSDFFQLDKRLYRHIAAGLITPVPVENWKDQGRDDLESPAEYAQDDANKLFFKPQDIMEWLLQHVAYMPPELLISIILSKKNAKAYFQSRRMRQITQSKASAEIRAGEWMADQIKNHANHGSKEMWLAAAKDAIPALSERQFLRVWANSATEAMKSAGRRGLRKAS